MPLTTTPSERIGLCTRMRRFPVRFIRPESFVHNPSLADFIITTSGFEFSVHTTGFLCGTLANVADPPGVAGERRRSAVVEVSSPPIRRQGYATRVSICGGTRRDAKCSCAADANWGDRKPLWGHYQK